MTPLKKHQISSGNTNLKAISQLLEQTNKELFAYKYALDESSIVAITDQKGIIQHVNDNFCKISKYSREELIGQDHRIINSNHHDKAFIKNLWHTIANGKIWKGELKNKAKDSSYYWVDTTIVPFLDKKDKPYLYIAIRSDITDRKLAELEIKRQTEQIENLLECITDGFIGLDKNLCYTYANNQIGEMLGIPAETLIGRNVWEVFPEAIGSPTYLGIQKALTERVYVCHEDYYAPLNLWQENRIYPIGEGLSIFIRDISKQKREEQHLKLLESVITHTNDAILITEAEPQDEPGPRIIYVNEAFTKMTGYSAEEVIGKSPRILQGPKTDRKELKRLGEALRKWEPCEVTVINYKKNGDEFWINFSVSPVADEKGWYTHWISIERDVTEKRKLDEEYNQIFQQAPDIICTVGLDGYFKKINPALSSILEYEEEELLTKPIVRFIHSDDQEQAMKEMEAQNKGDMSFYFECRCVTSSGNIRWIGWTSRPAFEDGLIFSVGKDITEKKELENLLHKANNLARIGGWDFDLINNTIYWSAVTREIHEVGIDYEPDLKTGTDFYKDTASREFIRQQIELAVTEGNSFDVEMQIVTAKQNVKWVRVIGEPEFAGKKCVRLVGSFQDIDELKKSEITANEALEERNTILESIGDAFFAVDKNWLVTYWNSTAEKVLQKTKQQTMGLNLWDIFSDAIGSVSYLNYHQAMETNEAAHFEDYYPPLKKWYEISSYPSKDGLSVYFKDVTERILSNMRLKELNQDLKEIAWMQSHTIRAPLSRILGLAEILKRSEGCDEEMFLVIKHLLSSASELDQVINNIHKKARVKSSRN